jgi:hypothetical protein
VVDGGLPLWLFRHSSSGQRGLLHVAALLRATLLRTLAGWDGWPPAGDAERGGGLHVDPPSRRQALLLLEGDQRLAGSRTKHPVGLAVEEAPSRRMIAPAGSPRR